MTLNLLVMLEGLMAVSALAKFTLHGKSSKENVHYRLRACRDVVVSCPYPPCPRIGLSLLACAWLEVLEDVMS